MATERLLNSDQEVVFSSITCRFQSTLHKRPAYPTCDFPLQPQAGSILKHILGIQPDARTQPFCCLPPTWVMPTPFHTCCHVSMNLKYYSLMKTWVLETVLFILELSYFQEQIMKVTKPLNLHLRLLFQGIFTVSQRAKSAKLVAIANSKSFS